MGINLVKMFKLMRKRWGHSLSKGILDREQEYAIIRIILIEEQHNGQKNS